jgi:Na+/H+-dicarboxylate symporter
MALAATNSTRAKSRLVGVCRASEFRVSVAIAIDATIGFASLATGRAMKSLRDVLIELLRTEIALSIFLTEVTGVRKRRELRSGGSVAGKTVATILVARWDGALDHEKLAAALAPRSPRQAEPAIAPPEFAE